MSDFDKAKAIATLNNLHLERCWQIYTADYSQLLRVPYEELTIRDIVSKLVRYGNVSDKQAEFMRRLLAKIDERSGFQAQRQAQHDAAADAPTGRLRVVGRVVSVKEVETNWGPKTNVLIVADAGWKCYGSRFNNIDKGDLVEFTATFQPTDDDSKFAWFKRPVWHATKAPAEGRQQ